MLSYCKQDSYHWLRFPALADFRISANVKEVFCYPVPEIPQETIQHLLLDQVLPRCLAYQGKILLHASAVGLGPAVILFLGDSGSGKSTLAGDFNQAGYPAISDDCLWIKEGKAAVKAIPNYGGLRLWDDSLHVLFPAEQNIFSVAHYSVKKRVAVNEHEMIKFRNGAPIRAVIVLSGTEQSSISEIILNRLSHREAFIALMKRSFHLSIMDPKRVQRHMRAVGSVVSRVPAFRLSMPRDYDLLPLVRQKILETVL